MRYRVTAALIGLQVPPPGRNVMTPSRFALAIVPLLASSIGAQMPASFEVASIKRNLSTDAGGGSLILPEGKFTASNVPLVLLLDVAYGIPPERVVGGPSWTRTDRYNVDARVGGKLDPDDLPRFMQNLLRDRFKLKARVEKRDTDVYALVVARSSGGLGPAVRPATFDCTNMETAKKGLATVSADGIPGCGERRSAGRFLTGGITLDSLVDVLTRASGRPVINRTNIDGRFDLRLEWAAEPRSPDRVSIFTALQEQLGLRLESQRMPMDTLVIDDVQRPTEN